MVGNRQETPRNGLQMLHPPAGKAGGSSADDGLDDIGHDLVLELVHGGNPAQPALQCIGGLVREKVLRDAGDHRVPRHAAQGFLRLGISVRPDVFKFVLAHCRQR